jgi:hypothetical protein
MIPALNKTPLPKFTRDSVKEGVRMFGGQSKHSRGVQWRQRKDNAKIDITYTVMARQICGTVSWSYQTPCFGILSADNWGTVKGVK